MGVGKVWGWGRGGRKRKGGASAKCAGAPLAITRRRALTARAPRRRSCRELAVCVAARSLA